MWKDPIVDEIHALAENKRGVHLSLTLERLEYLSDHMCRVGLSATVAPLEEVAKFLVGKDRDCLVSDVQFTKQLDLKVISPVKNIIKATQDELHKNLYKTLDDLIQEHRTTLVFTNTRAATENRGQSNGFAYFPQAWSCQVGCLWCVKAILGQGDLGTTCLNHENIILDQLFHEFHMDPVLFGPRVGAANYTGDTPDSSINNIIVQRRIGSSETPAQHVVNVFM